MEERKTNTKKMDHLFNHRMAIVAEFELSCSRDFISDWMIFCSVVNSASVDRFASSFWKRNKFYLKNKNKKKLCNTHPGTNGLFFFLNANVQIYGLRATQVSDLLNKVCDMNIIGGKMQKSGG